MLIEFKGPYFESWEPVPGLVWEAVPETHDTRKNPRVQEVTDPEVIANLLSQPGDGFVIAKGEPLLSLEGVGPVMAANLAMAGYGTQEALSKALVADQKALAGQLGLDEAVVKGWVATSKEAVKARQSAPEAPVAAAPTSGPATGGTTVSGPVGAASGPTEGPATTGGLAGSPNPTQ